MHHHNFTLLYFTTPSRYFTPQYPYYTKLLTSYHIALQHRDKTSPHPTSATHHRAPLYFTAALYSLTFALSDQTLLGNTHTEPDLTFAKQYHYNTKRYHYNTTFTLPTLYTSLHHHALSKRHLTYLYHYVELISG